MIWLCGFLWLMGFLAFLMFGDEIYSDMPKRYPTCEFLVALAWPIVVFAALSLAVVERARR